MKWKVIGSLVLLLVCATTTFAERERLAVRCEAGISIQQRESNLWTDFHRSRLSAFTTSAPRVTCERTDAPEALATPQPLLTGNQPSAKIVVSFIIGTDGQVHSPLILQSAGEARDATVLTAVRSWKFRPATCNGVPAEADGTVEFSRR